MAEFVTIGDLHLDKLLKYWPNANALKMSAVQRVIDYEFSEGRKNFVLLGDLSDGIRDATGNKIRLSEDAQCRLINFFLHNDGKVNIYVFLGNHDFAEEGSHSLQIFFELQRNKIFKTIRFYDASTLVKIDGIRACFVPYPNVHPIDGAQIAFGHYEVNGAMSDSGRKLTTDIEESDVPTVVGHLHTRQKVRGYHYPGTLYQLNFGESLPKGYGVARVSSKSFKYKWEQFDPPFKLINFTVEKSADLKKLSSNPLVLYKLYVPDDILVPENFLLEHPNIVNSLQFSSANELESLKRAELEIETADEAYDHEEFLPAYLKSVGASSWERKRAMEIIKDIGK